MLAIVIALFGIAALAHSAPFPFLLEAFRPSKSLWRVKPQPGAPPAIYLTFDDGPNGHWTPSGTGRLARTRRARDVFPHRRPHHADDIDTRQADRRRGSRHRPPQRLAASDGHGSGRSRRRASARIRAHRIHYRARAVPSLPAARRLAERNAVRGARSCRLPARRVELGNVGLGLVASASQRSRHTPPRTQGLTGRHHRDPRRASQEPRGRPQSCGGDGSSSRADPEGERILVSGIVRVATTTELEVLFELR